MTDDPVYLTDEAALESAPAELIEHAAAQALALAERSAAEDGAGDAGLYTRAQTLYAAALYRLHAEQATSGTGSPGMGGLS